MKRFCSILIALSMMAILIQAHAWFDIEIFGILQEKTHFKYPMSVFVDTESNNMIVADTGHNRMLQCLPEGDYIDSFTSGENMKPVKLVRDSGRRIIVCDNSNNTIQFFDRKGTFLSNFNSGTDPSTSVIKPISLAVDKQNRFFILDEQTCQVKVFEGGGSFLFSMGRKGSQEGELDNPTDIALDSSGNIYVVDSGNNRITVFDKNGNFSRVFGESDLLHPWGITVNGSTIYVSDTGNHRIVTFNMQGVKGDIIGQRGVLPNQFNYPTGIQIDGKGQLWIADSGNNRIIRIRKNVENLVVGWDSQTIEPTGLIENEGLIYVADKVSNLVNVYDVNTSTFVNSIGLSGTSATGLLNPVDCDFLPRGDLVVSDSGNCRIQVYSKNGEHLVSFGSRGSSSGQLDNPGGLTCTKSGQIIIADTGNKRVSVFSQGGTWEFDIKDRIEQPVDCAQDSLERIWVADTGAGEVLIYDKNGNYIKNLEGSGFSKPSSIFIDRFGRVFVADSRLGMVKVFSEAGYELSSFGLPGGPNSIENPPFLIEQPGHFLNPSGICATDTHVCISDTGNSRIQRVPLRMFGGLPILKVGSTELSFAKVPLKSSRELTLSLTNLGGGKIEGKIKASEPWVKITPEIFSDEIEIAVEAIGPNAKEGTRDATITIESNGGTVSIPVQARFFAGQVNRVVMTIGMNNVAVNDKRISVTPAPFAQANTKVVFVPFRFIGEGLGAKVTYGSNKITYMLEGKTLVLTLNSIQAKLDGKTIECKNPAYKFGQSVVVPLRYVVENLGGVLKVNGKQLTAEYP
ncbi:MAG: 6-bladed beta-propeller [Caldisericia bacterium]|nr:6-bladed beta-propeller [Caldisericia bacterium]